MPNSLRAFVLGWAPPSFAAAATPSTSKNSTNSTAGSNNGANNANGYMHGNTGCVSGGSHGSAGLVPLTSPLSPVGEVHPINRLPGINADNCFNGLNSVNTLNTLNKLVQGVGVQGVGVGAMGGQGGVGEQDAYAKEYSIFVGDLAPETSNSDLVTVFRNPVLGLRNDRAPKFIRPFASCKSAKIMLDSVTGVSRGYGFVRFTDEADQQRALIEMHGLYCLSRPMRISPATIKFKSPPPDLAQLASLLSLSALHTGPPSALPLALPSATTSTSNSTSANNNGIPSSVSSVSLANYQQQVQAASVSVSAPMAVQGAGDFGTGGEAYTSGQVQAQEYFQQQQQHCHYQQQLALQWNQALGHSQPLFGQQQAQVPCQGQVQVQVPGQPQTQTAATEEWKHHEYARAILGNLIGPNGEKLTSTDPYNTTVFVGGLSPLVGEETLRTFFLPFGEIHYVKVPVGKHCGFVQFVRKADAQRAINMQGFPDSTSHHAVLDLVVVCEQQMICSVCTAWTARYKCSTT
ncbi:hypothetical protein B0H14DRAFT_2508823 [Mycena olivaceomarginata]|nr:hypothetical protein B0H14DRAFT_2508823 [Mycena olivaceomarginata]